MAELTTEIQENLISDEFMNWNNTWKALPGAAAIINNEFKYGDYQIVLSVCLCLFISLFLFVYWISFLKSIRFYIYFHSFILFVYHGWREK